MENYVDGYVFPIKKKDIPVYLNVAEEVATIWKGYGAIEYREFVGDDLIFEGVQTFPELMNLLEDEIPIFGWVIFPTREIRDRAHQEVRKDKRMNEILAPLHENGRQIFDAKRMVFGGFKST